MKLAQSQVLQLSQLDVRLLEILEKKRVQKANQLAVVLGTSRQAVAYRLRALQKRGFVKCIDEKGWQVGTYWKREKEKIRDTPNGVEVVSGLEAITDKVEGLLKNTSTRTSYVLESVYYKDLSESERLAWKKMDKQIDEIFVRQGVMIRAVGNSESYRIFMESQEMYRDSIQADRRIIYKIIPEHILRLPYEEACTVCTIDSLVLHFYFKTERVEIFQSRQYANLIAKYYALAEQYGKQVDIYSALKKLQYGVQ